MNVLIAANDLHSRARAEKLVLESGHHVVGMAMDGRQALNMIDACLPDVCLVDCVLKYLDGPAVAREIGKKKRALPPLVVVRSGFKLPEALAQSPYYAHVLGWEEAARAISLGAERDVDGRVEGLIRSTLASLGFSPHIRGTGYLEQALKLCLLDEQRLKNLRDLVYLNIAKKECANPANVERDIRYAIENAWRYGKLKNLESYFGYTVLPERGKPTNRAFLAQMTDTIKRKCWRI